MYKTDEMIQLSIGTLARLHAQTVDVYCTIDHSKKQIAASLETLKRHDRVWSASSAHSTALPANPVIRVLL
jgi:hypothetical protein